MNKELTEVLEYPFKDPRVLSEALTHGSAAAQQGHTYERLEFLGDRVLSLVVAEMLYKSYPDEDEGKLARRYGALVRREALAEVASEIGLGDHIVMSRSEAAAGGRANPSLLADVCEAVIAALYLDGGLAPAEKFITTHWRGPMTRAQNPPIDAKTALQEWAQGRGLPLPAYRIADRSGPDHAPTFTIEVAVGDTTPAAGKGLTRRAAEQLAADTLLKRLGGDG